MEGTVHVEIRLNFFSELSQQKNMLVILPAQQNNSGSSNPLPSINCPLSVV